MIHCKAKGCPQPAYTDYCTYHENLKTKLRLNLPFEPHEKAEVKKQKWTQTFRVQTENREMAAIIVRNKFPGAKVVSIETIRKATRRTVGDYRVYFEVK